MKLYYSPGSCAMSLHIVLNEVGSNYEVERVNLKTKTTETGKDFNTINEQGAVPFLVLDNGETLSEGVAIMQYIADQHPSSELVPGTGTFERAKVQQWLNYISTELHKTHTPLFKQEYPEESKQIALNSIKKAYDFVSKKLDGKTYLMGDKFTVADAYLFTIINWHKFIHLDLSPWPVLVDYQKRVSERPAVRATMQQEGLLGKAVA